MPTLIIGQLNIKTSLAISASVHEKRPGCGAAASFVSETRLAKFVLHERLGARACNVRNLPSRAREAVFSGF